MKFWHKCAAAGVFGALVLSSVATTNSQQQSDSLTPWQQQATTTVAQQQETAQAQQATATATAQTQSGPNREGNPNPPPSSSPGTKNFSPYIDMSLYSVPSVQSIAQSTDQKHYTLAFITGNGCNAEWGDSVPLNQTATYMPHLDSDIQYVRSQGGDVTISFGGQAGQELAQTCTDVSSLQAQYQAVVTHYSATHLDFDIEGGQEGNATAYDRRDSALAALQAANPGLTISFTLPSSTTGLTSASLGLLSNALSHGVNIQVVNLMTMDYGSPNSAMGQASIDAANALYSELQTLFQSQNTSPPKSSSQLWSMVGITPMIGQNDSQGEIFSLDDAKQVLAFAQQNQIGELSFWAGARDNGGCAGQPTASPTCSGISQGDYAFINTFKAF